VNSARSGDVAWPADGDGVVAEFASGGARRGPRIWTPETLWWRAFKEIFMVERRC
jgi:hypothetical protein